MNRKSIVTALGALVMVAFAATAFAQSRTLGVSSIRTVTPVRTMPLRALHNINLPPILRRILGNNYYSHQFIDQLRDKLIRTGYLQPMPRQYQIPIHVRKPALSQAPKVVDRALQSKLYGPQPNSINAGFAFPGIGASDTPPDSIGCEPPDTDMAVGANNIVELVNLCGASGVGYFKIWNKTTGAVVQDTTSLAGMWAANTDCSNGNGDNIVMYDQLAQRWLMSQFNNGLTGICIAVSTTSDPTGSYNLYDFPIDPSNLTDYPKLGVWPDSYFVSTNDFLGGASFGYVNFTALDKAQMLAGDAAQMVVINGTQGGIDYSVLPAYLDGMTPPPAGDPGIFVNFGSPYETGSAYALNFWRMTVDWSNPSAATLTGPVSVAVDPFNDGICGLARNCIPEPSPATSSDYVDSLGDRLMFRLAYRNYGSHQAMVVNQTVGTGAAPSSPPAGIRWYEIDAPAGATSSSTFTIAQQGTYLPSDGNSRWMGSIAMDHVGDIGLGYSLSSTSVDPSGAYTGQTVGGTPGVLGAGETVFLAGTGVQEANGNRWGDYSATLIDPTDDCTFWTSQEYMSSTGSQWSTALGSFKFDNCSIGPTGTLSGTVTATASGSAIAGALVTLTPGDYVATTGPNGTYSATVPATSTGPMSYDATAAAFGYVTSSPATVVISNNTTTTQNFSLATAPSATLSGTVTDGSGHGYPLYAEVTVSTPGAGQVADLWTAPSTGDYSVSLPSGTNYTLAVTAHENGYTPASASVTLASGGSTENFGLTVGSACSAPGYGFAQGFGQDFNGSTFPPSGWTVVNAPPASTVTWKLNTTWGYGNFTGGTGTSADADSNAAGGSSGAYDTSLITPPLPVTSLPANAIMKYKANYIPLGGDELDLDYSTDGGTTWNHISQWTTAHGTLDGTGVDVQQPVGSYVPASGSIQFRWRYYSPGTSYNWYAQIDDVSIGACAPIAGGLIEGSVTDSNDNSPLIGAKVTDDTGASATTFANSADPNLANGLYILFSTPGTRTLTATDGKFSPGTASVTVANNSLGQQSFALKSAQFAPSPATFNVHVVVNEQLTKTLTITNSGNGAGVFNILAINAPAPAMVQTRPQGHGAPLHNVHGNFSPLNMLAQRQQGRRVSRSATPPAAATSAGAWTAVAAYPVPVLDGCAVADPTTGKVYSFTGVSNGAQTANDYVYDPGTDTWTPIADFPNGGLEKPACAEMNGKVYITDGDTTSFAQNDTLYIYDIASDSFSTGADYPGTGHEFAARGVALNGKFYVIGGCDGSTCTPYAGVNVYDPSSDSWSQAADYPTPIAWQGCAAGSSAIYCGGGFTSSSADTTAAYKYDPTSDAWTPIADLLYDNWAMAAIGTSDGHLLFQDGVTDGTATITNKGQIYDATSDSWTMLPNNIITTYRSADACGFYEFGGQDGSFTGITSAEVLPGYSSCGLSKIPWLTVSPTMGTLAAGDSAQVTLTFDGTGQQELTTSQGYLQVTGAPGTPPNVPLTVHWDAHPVNLGISGSVSPTGTVKAGDNLAYTLVVQNIQSSGSGSATQVEMTYKVPSGVTYLASNGDATSCTAAAGTVTCDFGTLAAGASDLETIVVQANQDADTVESTFTVSSREPDSDPSNNSAMISTNPNTGPVGPPGPPGPKGDKGSSGFGMLGLMGLLGLALSGEWIRRRRYQKRQ